MSVLDIDAETLKSPPFVGTFLDVMMSRHKQWRTEEAFVAHLRTHLQRLGAKVYLFFHRHYGELALHSPPASASASSSSVRGAERVAWSADADLSACSLAGVNDGTPIAPGRRAALNRSMVQALDATMRALGVTNGDVEIVEHLTHVLVTKIEHSVRQWHQVCGAGAAGSDAAGPLPPVVRLDFKTCHLFRNSIARGGRRTLRSSQRLSGADHGEVVTNNIP